MPGDGSDPATLLRQVARLYTRAQRKTAKDCRAICLIESAVVLAASGDQQTSERKFEEGLQLLRSSLRPNHPTLLKEQARYWSLRGRPDRGTTPLRAYLDEGYPIQSILSDPDFDNARRDPTIAAWFGRATP